MGKIAARRVPDFREASADVATSLPIQRAGVHFALDVGQACYQVAGGRIEASERTGIFRSHIGEIAADVERVARERGGANRSIGNPEVRIGELRFGELSGEDAQRRAGEQD